LFNRQIEETQASPDREAIGRDLKGGVSEKEVEVIAPPRMGDDSEGLLLGTPPLAIDRKPADHFGSNDKVFCRLSIPSERRASGFKRREAKTKVQTVKTRASEERRRPRSKQRRRRQAKRVEDQGPNNEDEGK